MNADSPSNMAPLVVIVGLVVVLALNQAVVEGTLQEIIRWAGVALLVIVALVAGLRSARR